MKRRAVALPVTDTGDPTEASLFHIIYSHCTDHGSEYLHSSPEGRKRQLKGNPVPFDMIWPVSNEKAKYGKLQTHSLLREGAPL
jgi:hypothetical protein